MENLSKIESLFFVDERNRDIIIGKRIREKKEFDFLETVSYWLHDSAFNEYEINRCLDAYNKSIENGFDKYSAKRLAIIKGMDAIYYR